MGSEPHQLTRFPVTAGAHSGAHWPDRPYLRGVAAMYHI